MNNLVGHKGSANPFYIENEVGTLLFEEYPTTIVFIDIEKRPIIREWTSCTKDGNIDRYFYYKTNVNNLNLFINGFISHKSFVKIAEGQLYYFEDISKKTIIDSSIITGTLPSEYYPGETFISEEDVVDIEELSASFRTNDSDYSEIVKQIATSENVETYDLHLGEGNGVGYGTIKTDLLGQSLTNFSNFYQETSLDILLNKDRGEVSKKKRRELEPFTSTIIYKNLAASYSVLIKPKYTVEHSPNRGEVESSSSIVAKKVFQLINTSLSYELLNEKVSDYSPKLVEAFRVFIQGIKDNHLNLSLSWYSPESKILHSEEITHDKASIIVANIEQLSVANEEPLTRTGKFDLLNCSTGHFGFNSNEESITGYFSENIKDGIRLVNFVDVYTVSIIKTTTRIAGKSEPKITHTLTAHYKDAVQIPPATD